MPLTTYRLKETTLPYDRRKSLTTPQAVAELMFEEYENSINDREVMYVILLNNKNKPLSVEPVSMGAINGTVADPRIIFKHAITKSATSLIMVHNHPSGDPTPSVEDISFTKQLDEGGKLLGINVLDHVIIGKTLNGNVRFYSLREGGDM